MDKPTAQGFLARLRQHRAAEQRIWDEMRDHPEYKQHEDKIVMEALDALDARDAAEEDANRAMGSFDFVPDPDNEGEFVHIHELDKRRRTI